MRTLTSKLVGTVGALLLLAACRIPTTPRKDLAISFVNDSEVNIHILGPGEDFEPSNKLAPGRSREYVFEAWGQGEVIRFRAGRDNQVFAEQACGHIKRSAGAPIVAYEGGIQLTCENW